MAQDDTGRVTCPYAVPWFRHGERAGAALKATASKATRKGRATKATDKIVADQARPPRPPQGEACPHGRPGDRPPRSIEGGTTHDHPPQRLL